MHHLFLITFSLILALFFGSIFFDLQVFVHDAVFATLLPVRFVVASQ